MLYKENETYCTVLGLLTLYHRGGWCADIGGKAGCFGSNHSDNENIRSGDCCV